MTSGRPSLNIPSARYEDARHPLSGTRFSLFVAPVVSTEEEGTDAVLRAESLGGLRIGLESGGEWLLRGGLALSGERDRSLNERGE